MSWDCKKIGCPFDVGDNKCTFDKKSCALIQRKYDYPYIKLAFEQCRADAIAEYKAKLREQFILYNDEHGYPCIADIREILDDVEVEIIGKDI